MKNKDSAENSNNAENTLENSNHKKGNPGLKIIGLLSGVLLILIGVFGFLNSGGEDLEEGKIVIKAGGEVIGEITLDEIRDLPTVTRRMTVSSTAGLTRHEYTATPLRGVLETLDPEITSKYRRIITRGADNYVSVFRMEEVTARNNVFLAYEDYGQPLPSLAGDKGGIKIVGMEDQFGQRFTDYLVELQLE